MATGFMPSPTLFTDSAGAGLKLGAGLAGLIQERRNRSKLQEIADMVRAGAFEDAGADLIGMGEVAPGIGLANVPFNRQQALAEQALSQNKFAADQSWKERDFSADEAYRRATLGLNERGFNADQAYRQQQIEMERARLGQGERKLNIEEGTAKLPNFDDENKLSKDFQGVTSGYREVRDAYTRIQSSARNPSPAGDLALIFNYMKMLDPGSVVRESEFATAENSAGVPERIRNMYNKVLSGERLGIDQRKDFVGRADELYKGAFGQYKSIEADYRRRAQAYGFEPDRVLGNFEPPATPANGPVDWQEYFK